MIKRIAGALAVLLLVLSLSGCWLAVGGKGTAKVTDALCGIFITFSPIREVSEIDGNAPLNQGAKRIYAAEKEDELGFSEYAFEGIEGIPMFQVLVAGDKEGEDYCADCSDDTSLEVSTGWSYEIGSSYGIGLRLAGVLYVYVTPELYDEYGDCILYCNPVYQNPAGEVYLLPARAGRMVLGTDEDSGEEGLPVNCTEGDLGTTTLSGSATIKIREKIYNWTSDISLTIMGINNVQKYILKEMNAQDEVISALEITPDNIPDMITLSNDTAFATLEEYSIGEDGEVHMESSKIDLDIYSFIIMFPGDMGLASLHRVVINNEEIDG